MALLPADPQKQKVFLVVLVVALGLPYVAYEYMVKDTLAQATRLESRHENLKSRNQQARRDTRRMGVAEVERQLSLYRDQLIAVEGLIPRNEELPDLLDAISAEAQRSGVDLARIQPTGATRETYYTRREYALAVRGTYHQIGDFLSRVGTLPRIITPINLNMLPGGQVTADGVPRLDADFSIETYVLPTPAEAAAAAERDAQPARRR